MRLVMLSTDSHILEPGSVQERIKSYGTVFESVTIFLFKRGENVDTYIAKNVHVIVPGGQSLLHALYRFYKSLYSFVSKETCDVVSTQDPFVLGLIGLIISKFKKIPIQVQMHTDPFSKGYWSESLRRLIEALIALFVIRGASCVRVVSERVKKSIVDKTHAPISILPIYVSPLARAQFQKPKEFSERFTVVAVSRLTKEKQLTVLIDALALLPSMRLIIVGDGPERKNLEQRRMERGIVDRVQFAGWHNDVGAYLQHANCYAQCSRYEGYGMSLIEAALNELPIVTTDVGVVGELLYDGTHLLVSKPTPESFAAALSRIQENSALRESLGHHAAERVSQSLLSPEEYLVKYKEALASCVL